MTAGKILACGLVLVGAVLLFALLQERDLAPEAGWEAALRDPRDAVKVPALDFFRRIDEEDAIVRIKRIDHQFAALFEDSNRSDAVVWRALETYDRLGFVNKSLLGDALRLLLENAACQVKAAALRAIGRHSDRKDSREWVLKIIQEPPHFPCIDAPPEEGEEPVGMPGVLAAALAAARDLEIPWSAGISRSETLQTLTWHFAHADSRVRAEAIETYVATGSQAIAYLGQLDAQLQRPQTNVYKRAAIFDVFAQLPEHARAYEASIDLLELDNDEMLTAAALRAREAIAPLNDLELLDLLGPGQSAHQAAVLAAIAERGVLGRGGRSRLTKIITNGDADPDLRAIAIGAIGRVEFIRSLVPELLRILATTTDQGDPEGTLRQAILRALAGLDGPADDLPTDPATLETVVLGLVDDTELGLPALRQTMVDIFWRAPIHSSQRVEPLLARLDSSRDPLVRAKAFELLARVPGAYVETIFENPEIVGFIHRELAARDPVSGVVRAAILRTLEAHDLDREHHDAILVLARDANNDPTGEVRDVAIPMAAANATTADLPILFGLLNHKSEETFVLAARSYWDLPIPAAVDFAHLIDPIHRRVERRAEILALAHVLGNGSPTTEMLIRLLDVGTAPAPSQLSSEKRQRLAFGQLRDMMLSSPFRRGVEGKSPRFLNARFRAKILDQLAALTRSIPWQCSDERMLASFLKEAKGTNNDELLFAGAKGEAFHDALSGTVRNLLDKNCGFFESIDRKTLFGWLGKAMLGLIVFVIEEIIRRRYFRKQPSNES